ncbi:MAG: outer membrane lipoprotein carrier protein LolA [Deltaproteobacteria bacterium]|nr:outer membrane lipoprotein carrier protein LolA [Deltaproteobacteria bacterium]
MNVHLLAFFVAAAASTSPPAKPATATSPAASAQAVPELRTVLERLQRRYDQAKDFRARFSQKYSRAVVGRSTLSTGTLTFKKPGRMRWDYDKPEPRMFLSNGRVLWLYEPSEKQAFKQDLKTSQLPAALAFLMGKGKIADEFEVEFAKAAEGGKSELPGRPGDIRLALSPKRPQSAYKSILFVVDPKEFLVRESRLVDAQGNANHFVFDRIEVNTRVADALFRWTPPAGIRVVDTDRMAK